MTEPSGAPGRRRPTLADVAARAGVSVPLVSIVMRDVPGASTANREKVRRAAEQLGYRPDSRARMLRRTRSRLIGVVFGVQHAFHGDLVSGLYAAADRLDYELALSAVTPGRDEHRAITSLLQDRCEALILLGPQVPTSYLADLATRMPTVVVARAVRHRAVDVVRTDDAPASTKPSITSSTWATPASPTSTADAPPAAPNADAATASAPAAQPRRGHLHPARRAHRGRRSRRRSKPPGHRPRPTAVTVFNDRCATGIFNVLWRAGLDIAADLSVIGFDDSLPRLAGAAGFAR